MTESEEEIYESIINQVRLGFFGIEEIKNTIYELLEDEELEDEIDRKWVDMHIESELQKLVKEEKNWNQPTDLDRLIKSFDELCENKIIALHNAGFTTSDGEHEVSEVEKELRKEGVKSDGYCFYHEQDVETALDPNYGLYIAFQKINNSDDEVTIAIGKRVVEVLIKYGFEINWKERASKKIEILNFDWKNLYQANKRNLLDYGNVVDLILKSSST